MYKYAPCTPGIANNVRYGEIYVKPGVVGRTPNSCGVSVPSISLQSESARMLAETCTNTVVNHTAITIAPSSTPPPVPVQTTSASVTTSALSQNVCLQQNNPYSPATRFSQYFPAPSCPYVPPSTMRSPNNYPMPSKKCGPTFQRYQSSAESIQNS